MIVESINLYLNEKKIWLFLPSVNDKTYDLLDVFLNIIITFWFFRTSETNIFIKKKRKKKKETVFALSIPLSTIQIENITIIISIDKLI